MEKILLALDANQHNTSTVDFACYIAKLTKSKLTGVFLEGIFPEENARLQSQAAGTGFEENTGENPAVSDPVTHNIHCFKESCLCRDTLHTVHRDRGVPLSEVVEESRFADLVIVDPVTSFSKSDRAVPSRFVKDVILDAECPVLIAPYSFDAIDSVIFTYNGSRSSVFAIKQFTYLFPALADKKAIIVQVRNDSEQHIEQQFKMKEWLKAHYREVEFVILKGDPADQLFAYLIEKKDAIAVMGAYGRSMLSRFFKPSQARLVVRTINLPVFITHQ